MSKFKSRQEKHEHRMRQEAARREQRMKDKQELEHCRENHIVGVNAIIPSKPGDYAGISRTEIEWKEYGEAEVEEMMTRMRSLPEAIKSVDSCRPVVRDLVLQDYAHWKMVNDCYQLPEDLAMFLRVSVAKNDIYVDLCKAIVGG